MATIVVLYNNTFTVLNQQIQILISKSKDVKRGAKSKILHLQT